MEERIKQLQDNVNTLLEWKRSITSNQIQLPIGPITKKIIQKDLLVATGKTLNGPFGSTEFDLWVEVLIDGDLFWLAAKQS